MIQRYITIPKVNKQHYQLQQTLSNLRICLFLLRVSVIKVGVLWQTSYFSVPEKVVTINEQECSGLQHIEGHPQLSIIDLQWFLPLTVLGAIALTANKQTNQQITL